MDKRTLSSAAIFGSKSAFSLQPLKRVDEIVESLSEGVGGWVGVTSARRHWSAIADAGAFLVPTGSTPDVRLLVVEWG